MNQTFSRFAMLVGKNNIQKLQNSKVIIFGIGGVGSYTVEALARSGVGHITMVDFDEISESNINRQLHSLHSTVGKSKTEVMKARIYDINPECEVKLIKQLIYTYENVKKIFENQKYDFVIDAIDVITSKINLIEFCVKNKIKIISSMGFGNKMHPEMIEIAKIKNTSVCPMARTIRSILKKKRITDVPVVYSKEVPLVPDKSELFKEEMPTEFRKNNEMPKKSTPGSNAFVPGTAGLILASYVVRKLLEIK
ncbi:tRNA threonylcarbamoyladenosine dehydratase [Leptotrichia sp. oral taxon 847]|uniref:tRNA threonylcarbamoyladenosine dehydratase n=1 Tax=Leptotrichia sp. oral taxon 847 TaxID=1785996 RepID=UPI0007681B3C|nr:tRNA threonylcarbamoyladenosine dehydratase [Leptotrichia sp. oral taxon 847]AMD94161.1 tRNA cyclic N6-threonylcarbamoyladenosine(37) synthase TcdA [Leptotrichia sp. oral taxon 847]